MPPLAPLVEILALNEQTIKAADGEVRIVPQGRTDKLRLEIRLDDSVFSNCCETEFAVPVIEYLVERIGCRDLVAVINRFEQSRVPAIVKSQLFSYFRPEDFRGKRLLDFGCGLGASTFRIAKMLPETEVVGIDVVPDKIAIAQSIAALQRVGNAEFLCSPSGDRLPDEIGRFDYVMLCAVYEHLLPRERQTLMPQLWSAMKEGAAIFINLTPYRYFPVEYHSTGLWFINYLPDRLAHLMARQFAMHDPEKYCRAIKK